MKHRTFFWFFLPTGLAMLLFIAAPIVSVVMQSMFAPHEAVLKTVENCGPFGCQPETTIDQEATRQLRAEQPLGRFVGLDIYIDRGHLAFSEVAAAWRAADGIGDFLSRLGNLPFYRAMAFTLTYTFVVTPLLIVLGLIIALAVNTLHRRLKGLVIFFSLLPMIVTPLVGSLILFWMIDSRGIIGAFIQWAANDPDLSLKASTGLTWIMLIVYGIWHSIPFSFIVFYAGLQTVPEDTLEAAMIDGATRWQRMRHVVVPHLMPLVTFITLIQLMDNFRVFEPIVGFKARPMRHRCPGSSTTTCARRGTALARRGDIDDDHHRGGDPAVAGAGAHLARLQGKATHGGHRRPNAQSAQPAVFSAGSSSCGCHRVLPVCLDALGQLQGQSDFFSRADWTNAIYGRNTRQETGSAFTTGGILRRLGAGRVLARGPEHRHRRASSPSSSR
jgi:ABC-type sugar transport system permease subunit